jgi:putative addiction module component (TIGR02574 family)
MELRYDETMKDQLLEEAGHLPVEERIELVEAIWNTVAEDAGLDVLPLSEVHRLELDRRIADLEADPDAGESWDKVRAELERR